MASDEQVAVLGAEVRRQTASIDAQTEALDRSDRLRRLILAVGVVVAVLFGLTGAGAVTVAVLNRQLNSQVHGCVTPGGDCYEDNQRRTGQALGSIAATDLANAAAVAVCAKGHDPADVTATALAKIVNCATALLDQLEE